jgi:hypothetical protein
VASVIYMRENKWTRAPDAFRRSRRLSSVIAALAFTALTPVAQAGSFPAVIDLGALDGSDGFRIEGGGLSVAGAGDVNGDGFADVTIGWEGGGSPPGAGLTYVVFGKASGFAPVFDLASLDGSNGFRIDGVAENDHSGWSVASAGDVNGDGFADLIIGAPDADPSRLDAGSSYVVFGRASGFAPVLELSSLDGSNGFRLDGKYGFGWSGASVASAGDVNGDGFADLIIGAPLVDSRGNRRAGSTYVVYGKASQFPSQLKLSSLDGSNGFRLDGEGTFDNSGWSVASAGDVNRDGFADVIVGTRRDPCGCSPQRSSYVVFGKHSKFPAQLKLSSLDGSKGFRLDGPFRSQSGRSVASARDVNGDGFADVIVGAPDSDPNGKSDAGSSYVVFGKPSGFPSQLKLSSLDGSNGFRIDGMSAGGQSGHSVASAGDVNADGFADVIVGAPQANPAGSSYVVFGKASGFPKKLKVSSLDGSNGFRLDGSAAQGGSGFSVASAGDINGDGVDDLIIGGGSSYVVFGRRPDGS